jgi:hypothetical protein
MFIVVFEPIGRKYPPRPTYPDPETLSARLLLVPGVSVISDAEV